MIALVLCALLLQEPPALAPGEKLIATLSPPKGATATILSVSPDGTAAVWLELREGKSSVVWNDGRLDDLDKVEPYCGWMGVPVLKVRKNGKLHVASGSTLSEPFDSASDPLISPGRKALAYVARDPGKVFVVTSKGRMDLPAVQETTLTISNDDEVFYVATVKSATGAPVVVSFLGQESKELKGYLGSGPAGPVAFAPDGTIAYTLLGRGTVQTTAGFTGPTFDRAFGLRFSNDGQVLAYAVEVPGPGGKTKKQSVVGGVVSPSKYDDIVGFPGISHDGKTVAYVAKKGTKWVVAQGTKFSDEYELIRPKVGDVDQPVVSGDGRTVAFVAEKQGKSLLVVNGRVMDEKSYIGAPVLNFNGSTVTYGYVAGALVIQKRSAVPGR